MKMAATFALSVAVALGTAANVRADQTPYPIPEYEMVAASSELEQRALATARQELARYSLKDAESYQGFVMRSARSVAVSFSKPGGCDIELIVELDVEGERVLDSHIMRNARCQSSL